MSQPPPLDLRLRCTAQQGNPRLITCKRRPSRPAGAGFVLSSPGLGALTQLQLAACTGVTDAGLADGVAGLAPLRVLSLRACPSFGDSGLASLAGLTRLQQLSVAGNRAVSER